jgi:tRNA A37 threonylcarbamoyladenosine modification protein TsaB
LAKEVPVMGWNSLSSLQGAPRSYAVLGDARRGQWQFSEIHEGKFHAAPQVMNEQEAQQRCSEYPGLIFTLDRSAPSWSRAYTTVPDAALLAAFVDTLTETEIAQLTAIPVEPIYLSEPFITVPRQNS